MWGLGNLSQAEWLAARAQSPSILYCKRETWYLRPTTLQHIYSSGKHGWGCRSNTWLVLIIKSRGAVVSAVIGPRENPGAILVVCGQIRAQGPPSIMDISKSRDPSLRSQIVPLNDINDSPSLTTVQSQVTPCQVISSSNDKSSGTNEGIFTVVPNWENIEKHSKRYLEGSRPHQNGNMLCL